MTVLNLRLPRILLAALTGAGLSAAGCAFQSLFANPLATPDTLGVASGASFGAALGLLLGLPILGVQLTALLMGGAAVAMTWVAGSGKSRGLSTVVLAGIMMGSLFNALVSLVKFVADEESQLPAITHWLMGGLNTAAFETLLMGAPLILAGILILYLLRWRMNLLPLSEDEVRSSGVNISVLRGITVVCATMITASCVSMCGQVGWVGLLIPHMCRMKFGSNHLSLVPASISFGAAFLMIVDTVARSATAQEIPISILTAIIGAPFFIILMRKSGGWSL
jgi:iron complex transport system permease protein